MLQQPEHVEIVLNDDNDDAEQIAAERGDVEHTTKKVRHRRHKRPFYRRVFNYIRTAWTGVHFSSSNGKSTNQSISFLSFLLIFHVVIFLLFVFACFSRFSVIRFNKAWIKSELTFFCYDICAEKSFVQREKNW